MRIDKAIEILEIETNICHEPSDPDLYDAQLLGIEALKRVRQLRVIELNPEAHHLPGETKE